MNISEALIGLHLFNEKAAKLETLSFTKRIVQEKQTLNISIKPVGDDLTEFLVNRSGPDAEAIDAFVLTFRFFIQDNERSSFGNLASVYKNPLIPEEIRNEFAEIRSLINEHLAALPEFGVEIGDHKFKRREILEIFIYGGLSHANDDKYKKFNEFKNSGPLYGFAEWEFTLILTRILVAIRWIRDLNFRTIAALNSY